MIVCRESFDSYEEYNEAMECRRQRRAGAEAAFEADRKYPGTTGQGLPPPLSKEELEVRRGETRQSALDAQAEVRKAAESLSQGLQGLLAKLPQEGRS